jgi:hypothetical protein
MTDLIDDFELPESTPPPAPKRIARVQSGVVSNVSRIAGRMPAPDGWVVSDTANIGDLWDGEKFSPSPSPLPTAKDVYAEADRRLKALAAAYSPQERETWATQVDEAKAVKAGATDAPLLSPLAVVRGWTLDEMADRVLLLAAQFAAASGAILAARNSLAAMDPIPQDYADDGRWVI